MTQAAHCPNCNSTLYSPDPSNGGAGRNKCLECGKASPVAGWYVADKGVMIVHRKELVPQFPPGTKVAVASGDPDPLNIPSDSRRWMVPPRRMKHDKPAAPIRQYKDD